MVVFLGALLRAEDNLAISLLATGLVAVLFAPLRDRLQRAVNRLMYGERDEPYRVLARLGQRLEATLAPDAVLPTVVETIAQALKLSYAAVAVPQDQGWVITAAYGTPHGTPVSVPLVYSNEMVGRLLLCSRAPGEAFTAADEQLLTDLARQVGIAAHATRLTANLQRANEHLRAARESLVTAREEERRRLRRDLHDGLGPQLAGFSLRLDAVRNLLRRDPDAAERLVQDVADRMQSALADIRRLVYALRPPALDELGLIPTLRQHAAQYTATGLQITIDAPEEMRQLPAAVEVAAYRIVTEALTNVMRHARAKLCVVRIAVNDDVLGIQISDDGQGIADDHRIGVGLTSMRERAEELGGSFTIEAPPGAGTRIRVHLPLPLATTAPASEPARG
jgi:signal transduction histidine kinase